MIRYVFCLEIVASQIWALFEFLFFHSVASFFSSGLRDDSSSSSSSSSALKICARENTRHHSLTFFFVRLLLLLLLLYYYYSDGASYSQAMCSPKLNPLIVSGMFFKQHRGVPPRAKSSFRLNDREAFVFPLPLSHLYPFTRGPLQMRLLSETHTFSLFFEYVCEKQSNCESTPSCASWTSCTTSSRTR